MHLVSKIKANAELNSRTIPNLEDVSKVVDHTGFLEYLAVDTRPAKLNQKNTILSLVDARIPNPRIGYLPAYPAKHSYLSTTVQIA
jgi:hypothetical protein